MRRLLAGEPHPGPIPQDLKDFETMRDIPCSHPELMATPWYTRERYWEYLQHRRHLEASARGDRASGLAASSKQRMTLGDLAAAQGGEVPEL